MDSMQKDYWLVWNVRRYESAPWQSQRPAFSTLQDGQPKSTGVAFRLCLSSSTHTIRLSLFSRLDFLYFFILLFLNQSVNESATD